MHTICLRLLAHCNLIQLTLQSPHRGGWFNLGVQTSRGSFNLWGTCFCFFNSCLKSGYEYTANWLAGSYDSHCVCQPPIDQKKDTAASHNDDTISTWLMLPAWDWQNCKLKKAMHTCINDSVHTLTQQDSRTCYSVCYIYIPHQTATLPSTP